MYQLKITPFTQFLVIATILSSSLLASACSAESSSTPVFSNQDTPAEIYKLGLAYSERDSVPEDDDNAFEWYKKAADQGNQEASNRIGRLVMNGKIDDKDIVIYSTQETGLTLGDIEKMSQ